MSDVFHCNRSSFDGLEHYYRPKVEVQMAELERNFNCHAEPGTCSVCGENAPVMADIATMRYRCFACCMKERLAYEEAQERRKKRIPLDMEDFCK